MKVLFNFSAQSVCIEGDGPELVKLLELVRDVSPNLPEITIQTQGGSPPAKNGGDNVGGNGGGHGGETLRQFARKLHLTSNSEKIAAIAYYKNENESAESFSPKEMGEWFTNCGFQKPNQMPVAVHDARKRHGYVESAGHGRWKLTTNGLNLVIGKLNSSTEE